MTAVDKCFSMYEQAFLAKRVSRRESQEQPHVTLVAYFIVLVSSTYALESESGKRDVFMYSVSHFVVGLVFLT